MDIVRKRQFAFSCIAFSVPITLVFVIVDLIEGDTLEVLIDSLMIFVLLAGFIVIRKYHADLKIYRTTLTLVSILFLYNVAIGSGKGTVLYWLFSFPLFFLFFLGKKEGGIYSVVFLCFLCMLLLNPFSFKIYQYDVGISLRFLISLLFVTLVAYGLEAAREKYINLLVEEQKKLTTEKQNLESALGEIKTLSGLIPICSHCKKIRDDKGYWQQVEVYVRKHSTADFSHGICPDCAQKYHAELYRLLPPKK